MSTPGRPGAHPAAGMTLVELLVVMAVVGILAAIAIPRMTGARDAAVEAAALAELRMLDSEIRRHEVENSELPADLAAFERAGLRDAWGSPWTYVRGGGRLNTDYDLYSLGPDRSESDDDIVRAGDGAYFGVLSER